MFSKLPTGTLEQRLPSTLVVSLQRTAKYGTTIKIYTVHQISGRQMTQLKQTKKQCGGVFFLILSLSIRTRILLLSCTPGHTIGYRQTHTHSVENIDRESIILVCLFGTLLSLYISFAAYLS